MKVLNTTLAKIIDEKLQKEGISFPLEDILDGLDAGRTPDDEAQQELTEEDISDMVDLEIDGIKTVIECRE